MKRSFWFIVSMLVCSVSLAERPILLVTPNGVWQSVVRDGVPGAWEPAAVDVIVQGFDGGGGNAPPAPTPIPPVTDPETKLVQEISKSVLKDLQEATAVGALVDTLAGLELQDADFKEAMTLAIPVADTSLQAAGRMVKWSEQVLAVTTDPKKLKAGLMAAFPLKQETLDTIRTASMAPADAAIPEEALDWQQLIQIIQMIITLLKNLNIIR